MQSNATTNLPPSSTSDPQAQTTNDAASKPKDGSALSKREAALLPALQVAEAFSKGAAGCGVVGVESAANLLTVFIQQLQTVYDNAEKYKELVEGTASLITELEKVLDQIRLTNEDHQAPLVLPALEDEFRTRVQGLVTDLHQVKQAVEKLQSRTSGKGPKAFGKKVLFAMPNKVSLDNMIKAVNNATQKFAFGNSITIVTILRDLTAKVERQAAQFEAARQAAEAAQRTREENDRRNEEDRKWQARLQSLSHASAAYFSAGQEIKAPLEGTRRELLADIDTWATCDSTSAENFPFYVLTGGAGTGKSTIAYGVADRARTRLRQGADGQLAASFFFMRGAADRDSTRLVFQTLARQMLLSVRALRSTVLPALEEYLALGEVPSLEVQAKFLFEGLLSKLPADHKPLVIVIDAVDECTVANDAIHMLKLIMDGLRQITCCVRVFVTSRPEVHVEHALQSPPFVAIPDSSDSVDKLRRFRLHEIPQDIVDRDIMLYFETKLREENLLNGRPALEVAKELSSLAAGLFIYATTIVEYLRTCVTVRMVPDLAPLSGGDRTVPAHALEKLDMLYLLILDQTPSRAPDRNKALATMKAVLGYIAVLQDHLSPNALCALTPPEQREYVLVVLRCLAPVLSFDPEKPDVPVRPLHASFIDFLLDSTRCEAKYLVSPSEQHLRLAISTLKLVKAPETVTYYISNVKQSSRSCSSVHFKPFDFVPDAMWYACVHWPAHVTRLDSKLLLTLGEEPAAPTGGSDASVWKLVHDYLEVASAFFVPVHLLRWIEVLGYLQCLGTATDWLPTLHRTFSDLDKSLADLLYDAYRLVITFYPVLVEEPRHLYISALPQCPDTSPLRACIPRYCTPKALAAPRSLLPYPAWSPSVTHETERVPSIAFRPHKYRWLIRPSPDGQWVAASLRSYGRGDIHLRDATTGILLRCLHVHASRLVDFGISSDSRFIVSATRDGEICITDSSSGIPVVRYNHSDGYITRVAFRCKDSELLLVHTHRGDGLARPVHFLILDWERTEGGLRPRSESDGLRRETRYQYLRDPKPWSISPDGRWGVLWTTGDLLDLYSFAKVKFSFIPDTTALSPRQAMICGAWLSPSLLVYSVPNTGGGSLIVVDIGQDMKEVEPRVIRSVPTPHIFYAMEASANGSLVALHGDTSSSDCIFLWDPTGDTIRLVKHASHCNFCLSPHGDALYLAVDSKWSVIPTSQSSIATAQPLHSRALKFSATRDTIMVATNRPPHSSGWEVGILSRGFSSSPPSTASVVPRHYFGDRPSIGRAALTPVPHSMIFPGTDVVLHSMVDSSKRFPDRSRHSEDQRYPTYWQHASMSPNLSRIVACGLTPNTKASSDQELTFAVWDTASASLLHAFRTPRPSLPGPRYPRKEIVVTDALDIFYLLGHRSFAFRYADWSTSNPDAPRLLPTPEPGPVPGEWFRIGNDGWVTRSDGHPEVHRGQERLFWIPHSQRKLRRSDQHLLAMTTEYDVIVLDLSDFDDDTKEQYVPRLQTEYDGIVLDLSYFDDDTKEQYVPRLQTEDE